jgi:hypothetical protein
LQADDSRDGTREERETPRSEDERCEMIRPWRRPRLAVALAAAWLLAACGGGTGGGSGGTPTLNWQYLATHPVGGVRSPG